MYTETINTIPRIYRILACPRKARILGWREKKKETNVKQRMDVNLSNYRVPYMYLKTTSSI